MPLLVRTHQMAIGPIVHNYSVAHDCRWHRPIPSICCWNRPSFQSTSCWDGVEECPQSSNRDSGVSHLTHTGRSLSVETTLKSQNTCCRAYTLSCSTVKSARLVAVDDGKRSLLRVVVGILKSIRSELVCTLYTVSSWSEECSQPPTKYARDQAPQMRG
jgi:hypothetical protein